MFRGNLADTTIFVHHPVQSRTPAMKYRHFRREKAFRPCTIGQTLLSNMLEMNCVFIHVFMLLITILLLVLAGCTGTGSFFVCFLALISATSQNNFSSSNALAFVFFTEEEEEEEERCVNSGGGAAVANNLLQPPVLFGFSCSFFFFC